MRGLYFIIFQVNYSVIRLVGKVLYGFIPTVSDAGKIIYKDPVKADEYTVTKLIGRMRSGNEGGVNV